MDAFLTLFLIFALIAFGVAAYLQSIRFVAVGLFLWLLVETVARF